MTKQHVITQPGWIEGRKEKVAKAEKKDFAISVIAWCVCLICVALFSYYVGAHEDTFNVPVTLSLGVISLGFIVYVSTINQWWQTLKWAAGLEQDKAQALADFHECQEERNRAQGAYEVAKKQCDQAHDALRKKNNATDIYLGLLVDAALLQAFQRGVELSTGGYLVVNQPTKVAADWLFNPKNDMGDFNHLVMKRIMARIDSPVGTSVFAAGFEVKDSTLVFRLHSSFANWLQNNSGYVHAFTLPHLVIDAQCEFRASNSKEVQS